MNLQPYGREAKPYQVRQVVEVIARYAVSVGGRRVTTDYHIDVFYSVEDESWIADVPDLRHCSAHGATPEDAVREVMVAMDAWLATAREHGDPIPPATYRPATSAAG
ncbi:MAG TPA: type II toxin-antitoxin system HicB family antitoxin [Candidatus Dormibacteraeota bacterium]|nr:type II toxin-antitoxin system HicB family antitoxin [Candidatus Dormibacteraeota bacterium]